jgi:hypothetical protein
MQTTLRIDDAVFRQAKAEAARRGVTLTKFIEQALMESILRETPLSTEAFERNQLMESLLLRTAHFRIGKKPEREEMNER